MSCRTHDVKQEHERVEPARMTSRQNAGDAGTQVSPQRGSSFTTRKMQKITRARPNIELNEDDEVVLTEAACSWPLPLVLTRLSCVRVTGRHRHCLWSSSAHPGGCVSSEIWRSSCISSALPRMPPAALTREPPAALAGVHSISLRWQARLAVLTVDKLFIASKVTRVRQLSLRLSWHRTTDHLHADTCAYTGGICATRRIVGEA